MRFSIWRAKKKSSVVLKTANLFLICCMDILYCYRRRRIQNSLTEFTWYFKEIHWKTFQMIEVYQRCIYHLNACLFWIRNIKIPLWNEELWVAENWFENKGTKGTITLHSLICLYPREVMQRLKNLSFSLAACSVIVHSGCICMRMCGFS